MNQANPKQKASRNRHSEVIAVRRIKPGTQEHSRALGKALEFIDGALAKFAKEKPRA